jgi:hypothetical protein
MRPRPLPGERWIPPVEIPAVPHVPHPTTTVEWGGGFSADIDVEIAPLLKLVWENGIDTVSSCQDIDGRVHVEFDSSIDLCRFVELVAAPSTDVESLYNRCGAGGHVPDDWQDFRLHRMWHYSASVPVDLNYGGRRPRFELPVSVFFPRSDLAAVVAALGGDVPGRLGATS